MAEERDRLIFEIEIQEGAAKEKVKSLRKEIADLKQQKKDLDTLNKNGVLSAEKYAESLADIEDATKKANEELRKNAKTVELTSKANDTSSGYITQLRAQLSLLKTQWAGLSEEEFKNAQIGGKLAKEIKARTEEMKDYEKEIGVTSRNVGNYEEAIRKALGEHEGFFNKVSSAIDTLKEFRDGWKDQAASVKEYRTAILGQLTAIRATVQGMSATEVASTAAAKGTQLFGLALKGLGIGLIIAALAGLIGFLTKSQEGMDFVARKTAALSAVFTVLLNRVVPIGKTILKVFTEPKQGLIELGSLIKDNVINRLAAFKVIADGLINLDWRKMADGFLQGITGAKGLASDAKKAADQAEVLTKKAQELRNAEREIEVQRAKNRADIEKQKLIAEDTTKSLKEREAAAKEAFRIENKLLKDQESVQLRVLKNARDEAALYKVGSKEGVEAAEKIAEAEIKLGEIREDSLGKQTELNNSLNSIRQEAADKAKEAAEKVAEAEQKELDLLAKKLALRAEIGKINGQDTTALDIASIRAAAKAEANQFKDNADAKKLIIEKGEAEINKLILDKEAERMTLQAETRKAGLEAQLALVEEGTAKELTLREKLIKEDAELSRIQARQQITNKTRLAAELAKIDAGEKKALLDAEKAFADKQIAIVDEVNERRARMSKNLTDRIKTDLEKRNRDGIAANEAELANVREGSFKEYKLKVANIQKRAAYELLNENLTANERLAIIRRANKDIEKETKGYLDLVANKIVNLGEQVNSALSSIAEAQAQVQINNLDKQQKAALDSAGLNADMREKIEKNFAAKREKIEKEAAEKRKKIALAESYINEAKAIIGILGQASDPITKALLIAAAHITAAQNRAIIQTQQFAYGGFVSDGRGAMVRGAGTGKSDSIPARLSNGESVINANSTAMFKPLLSWINELGGGKPFHHGPDLGAVTRGLATGGVVTTSTQTAPGVDPDVLRQAIADALKYMPTPVVSVQEISTKQNRVLVRESRHDL